MNIPKRGLIQRIFHVYPEERRNSLLFAFLGFIWAFAATCGLKFADALFLLHVGAESLPTAYTCTACGMFGIAFVLLYAYHRFSSYQIYLSVLSIGICFYFLIFTFRLFHIENEPLWFWYALKLNGFFLFAVLMTCYWTFIDQYHHMQNSKRLYSLFSSTIFIGAASTGFVMQSGFLDLNYWILMTISLLLTTIFWIRHIAKKIPVIAHEEDSLPGEINETKNSFFFLIQSILASRFTLLVMICNFTVYLLLVITEYNYMSSFQHYFANSPNASAGGGTEAQLTLFLGKCISAVSCSNLFFGLFIYSRLVRRFGISVMLIITPILLIIAFTGWSLSPSLIFPLIGFFVVEGTLLVIDDSNFNLLLNAVPVRLKYKIRALIESFLEPLGMLTSALLLSYFQENSKWLGLLLAGCLLIIAFTIRQSYLQALFFNLSENAIHFRRSVKNWIQKMNRSDQKSTEAKLIALLSNENDNEKLFAVEGLLGYDNPLLLKQIFNAFNHTTSETKTKLLQQIQKSSFSNHPDVIHKIHEWVAEDKDPTLNFFLTKKIPEHDVKSAIRLIKSDSQLRFEALRTLEASEDLTIIPSLIYSSTHFLPSEKRMIEQIISKMGEKAIDPLLKLLSDDSLPHPNRLLAGKTIGRISPSKLQAHLSHIIQHEIDRAYFYFYHAHSIQVREPTLDLTLLSEILLTDYQTVIDFIIQLLGISDKVEDEELLSRSLKSKNPKVRSQVIETLEKTVDPLIFRLLQPLIEDIPKEEKMRSYIKNGHQPLNLNALIDKMKGSPLQIDRLKAVALKYELKLPGWMDDLQEQFSSRDHISHHFAAELLDT
jgi:hypothetical protein